MTPIGPRRRALNWPLLLAIVALLGACRPSPALTVNGDPIAQADLDAAAHAAGVAPDAPELIETLIEEALLLQDAVEIGLRVLPADLDAAMDRAAEAAGGVEALRRRVREAGYSIRRYRIDLERRLLTAAYLDRLASEVTIDDDTLRAHFDQNRGRFAEPERFAVTLLRYPDLPSAEAARAALLAGEPLPQALAAAGPGSGATELSASETSPVRRTLLATADATPFGAPSAPLPYGDGYLLLVPTGHRLAYQPSFEEVAPSLQAQLEQAATHALLRGRLAQLRSEATIVRGDVAERR